MSSAASVPQTRQIEHRTNDVLDYSADFRSEDVDEEHRLADDETIVTHAWSVISGTAMLANAADGTPATTVNGTLNVAEDVTTVWVVEAALGIVIIRHTVVTSEARTLTPRLKLKVIP